MRIGTTKAKENLFEGIKAVIFDMDGTIVNNMPFHKAAWKEFLKKYGILLPDRKFRKLLSGKKNNDILEVVLRRKLTDEEIKELGEEKEAIYRELYSAYIQEVPGLSVLIQELKYRALKLAIATTAIAKNRNFVLERLSLDGNLFNAIIGDENVKRGKPDPEIFLLTAKELRTQPAECLVFEDTPSGVEAAKRAGMRVVGILTSHTPEELKAADFTVDNFEQILKVMHKEV